jgi:hypothetical protein
VRARLASNKVTEYPVANRLEAIALPFIACLGLSEDARTATFALFDEWRLFYWFFKVCLRMYFKRLRNFRGSIDSQGFLDLLLELGVQHDQPSAAFFRAGYKVLLAIFISSGKKFFCGLELFYLGIIRKPSFLRGDDFVVLKFYRGFFPQILNGNCF